MKLPATWNTNFLSQFLSLVGHELPFFILHHSLRSQQDHLLMSSEPVQETFSSAQQTVSSKTPHFTLKTRTQTPRGEFTFYQQNTHGHLSKTHQMHNKTCAFSEDLFSMRFPFEVEPNTVSWTLLVSRCLKHLWYTAFSICYRSQVTSHVCRLGI